MLVKSLDLQSGKYLPRLGGPQARCYLLFDIYSSTVIIIMPRKGDVTVGTQIQSGLFKKTMGGVGI